MRAFYETRVLPQLVHLVCGGEPIARQRAKVAPTATGRVLDLGTIYLPGPRFAGFGYHGEARPR